MSVLDNFVTCPPVTTEWGYTVLNVSFIYMHNIIMVYINHCHILAFSLLLDGNFTCQNGELHRNNTTNALHFCFNGGWRTLCYNEYLWGPTQATVACRELNPGRMVTSKHNYE